MSIVYVEVRILKRIASQGFFNLPNTPIMMFLFWASTLICITL